MKMNLETNNQGNEKNILAKRIQTLAIELHQKQEVFPFTGIDENAYMRIKAAQAIFTEPTEYGYTTPIDTLIERFKQEGMKVVLGTDPTSGNVYILPSESNDIEMDSIFPSQLNPDGVTDEKLKELITRKRAWEKLHGY